MIPVSSEFWSHAFLMGMEIQSWWEKRPGSVFVSLSHSYVLGLFQWNTVVSEKSYLGEKKLPGC